MKIDTVHPGYPPVAAGDRPRPGGRPRAVRHDLVIMLPPGPTRRPGGAAGNSVGPFTIRTSAFTKRSSHSVASR